MCCIYTHWTAVTIPLSLSPHRLLLAREAGREKKAYTQVTSHILPPLLCHLNTHTLLTYLLISTIVVEYNIIVCAIEYSVIMGDDYTVDTESGDCQIELKKH